MISMENWKISLKSDSEVGFNDFPDIEELILRQNTIETEVWEQITDGQTVRSEQAASHEGVLQQLNHKNESTESDAQAEASVPQTKNTQISNSSNNLKARFQQTRLFLVWVLPNCRGLWVIVCCS